MEKNLESENIGSATQATVWAGSNSFCKKVISGQGGIPAQTHIRVARRDQMDASDGEFKTWESFEENGSLQIYALAFLNIMLVQGGQNGGEGCVLDYIPGYSGSPANETNCAQILKQSENKSSENLSADEKARKAFCESGSAFKSGVRVQPSSSFLPWKLGIAQSGQPLPEGVYNIQGEQWAGSVGNFTSRLGSQKLAGLGPVFWGLEPNKNFAFMQNGKRSGIMMHVDVNESSAPGTVGCLAVPREEVNRLMCWMRNYKPKTLVADWNLGSMKGMQTSVLDSSQIDGSNVVSNLGTSVGSSGNKFLCDDGVSSNYPKAPNCNWWQTKRPTCNLADAGCSELISEWEQTKCVK